MDMLETSPPSDRMLIDALCIVLAMQNQIHMPAPASAEARIISRAREIVYHYGVQAIARIAGAQGVPSSQEQVRERDKP